MKAKTVYIVAIILGVAGMALSGYLSWHVLFSEGCSEAIITCSSDPIEIFGLPTCIYGFFMYLIVTILSLIGLFKSRIRALMKSVLVIAVIGTGFSGFLSYYEIFVIDTSLDSLPACVYGLILYITMLIVVSIGLRVPQISDTEVPPVTPTE